MISLSLAKWEGYGTSRNEPSLPISGMQWLPMDVCDELSSKAVTEVVSRCGRLEALVCSAGMAVYGSAEELTEAASLRQFDVNVHGTLRCLPHFPICARPAAGKSR